MPIRGGRASDDVRVLPGVLDEEIPISDTSRFYGSVEQRCEITLGLSATMERQWR